MVGKVIWKFVRIDSVIYSVKVELWMLILKLIVCEVFLFRFMVVDMKYFVSSEMMLNVMIVGLRLVKLVISVLNFDIMVIRVKLVRIIVEMILNVFCILVVKLDVKV